MIEKNKTNTMNSIKNISDRSKIYLILFALIIIVPICHYFLGANFDNTIWILDIFIACIIIFAFIVTAGFAVMKSLFFVAAETSLLIFLSQSYCTVGVNRTILTDNALRNLLIVGFAYIVISFLYSLWKELKEHYDIAKESKPFEKIIGIIFFLAFVVFFIWQIYLVIEPIIQGLCVSVL